MGHPKKDLLADLPSKNMSKKSSVYVALFVAFLMLSGGIFLQSINSGVASASSPPASTSTNSTFVVGWGGPNIDTLNPLTSVNAWPHRIFTEVYSTLCVFAPNETALLPDLAESWQIYYSNGTAIFHLNPNAKWSDGIQITSQDVNYSYYLAKQPFSSISPDVAMITSISTPDNETIIFHFYGALFTVMAVTNVFIVPYHIWSKIENVGTYFGYNSSAPFVGSGPFVISSYKPNQYITLSKNPYFFIPSRMPHVDTVIWEYFTTITSEVSALLSGEIDAMGPSIEPGEISMVKSDSNLITVQSPPDMYYYLGFNTNPRGQGPTSLWNVTVRQAIAYAINDSNLTASVLHDIGITVGTVFPPGQPFADPSLAPYPYDPAKAEQMLNNSGYKIGPDGIRYNPNGTPMAFTIDTLSNYPEMIDAANIIASYLRDIGIQVTVQAMDVGTLINTIWPNYKFSLDIWDWPTDPASPYPLSVFLSWQVQSGVDDSGYYNTTYDHLYEQMMNASSISEAKNIAYQLEQSIHWNLPYYPLFTIIPFQAYSNQWTGVNTSFAGGPFGSYDWMTLSSVHLKSTSRPTTPPTNFALVIGAIIIIIAVVAAIVIYVSSLRRRKAKEMKEITVA